MSATTSGWKLFGWAGHRGKSRTATKVAPKSEPVKTPAKVKAKARADDSASGPASAVWLGADVTNGFFLLAATVGILCAFGAMMVLSASSVVALADYGSSWFFFRRQLLWLLVGAVALVIMSRIPYQILRRWGPLLIGASAVLLLLVLIPGIGVVVGGSRRWLGPGMFRFQPSEIAKLAVLVYGADLFARRAHLMHNWRVTLKPFGLVFLFFGALIMLQPDMGTTLILGAIAVTLTWVAGTPGKYMARVFAGTIISATVLAVIEPYRRARLMSFTDPFADPANTGYQMVQSLVGIGEGGIFGVGLGASRAKWGFLPNAHTDFIYSIVAEELGLIGAAAVALLFVGFAVLGIRAATRAPDHFGMLLASAITMWVVFQAFLNIGAVIGLLPVTGVPLPFLSQGGTALITLMVATGILLNIARQGEREAARRTRSVVEPILSGR